MRCAESLRVQAFFDGELDAVSSADIERHKEHCAECRALLEELAQLRTALRRQLTFDHAPPALRSRLLRALAAEGTLPADTRRRAFRWPAPHGRPRALWTAALSGIGGAALAVLVTLGALTPRSGLLDELVSAHVRSLMPDHLIDVVSTDKHTVKPWFAGHADVSPVVADFEPQGYRLIGGRADYVEHQRVAVVVYRHGAHIINVFSWAGMHGAVPSDATHDGYHLAFWREGDLDYCAVSDTGWSELRGLVQLLEDANARDAR